MNAVHWADAYIGKPYAYGAGGPHAYDCWGLACAVHRAQWGVALPDVLYADDWREKARRLSEEQAGPLWLRVDSPQEGDIVLMGRSRLPVHVGTWIRANGTYGVLHSVEELGVSFLARRDIAAHGWRRLQFYRFTGGRV